MQPIYGKTSHKSVALHDAININIIIIIVVVVVNRWGKCYQSIRINMMHAAMRAPFKSHHRARTILQFVLLLWSMKRQADQTFENLRIVATTCFRFCYPKFSSPLSALISYILDVLPGSLCEIHVWRSWSWSMENNSLAYRYLNVDS